MPSQSYRGHVIEVTCRSLAGRTAYLSSVKAAGTGELRHRESAMTLLFDSDTRACDHAFAEARRWVERFPLRWPFPVGA